MRSASSSDEVVLPAGSTLATSLDVDKLPRLSIVELRRLWTEHIGPRIAPPQQKCVLIRELAWRLQERVHGGFDAETKRLLKLAMRAATGGVQARIQSADGASTSAFRPARPRRTKAARALTTSSHLMRTWRGRVHEVEVLDGGRRFLYRDREFKSLSEIARLITGGHWSGPRFFGLVNRRDSGHAEGE